MTEVHKNYQDFSRKFLEVGQDFIGSKHVKSSIHFFGSKSFQVLTGDYVRDDGIDPIEGLLKNNTTEFADYTIVFMDGKSTGFFPNIKQFDRHDAPLGQVRSYLTAPYRVAFDAHSNTIQVHDPASSVVVIWSPDVSNYPYWAAATPFRLALAWIADTFDGEMLHGAAVEKDDKCLILAGRSGAGKSTFSFVARKEGFKILSDDYFLYENDLFYPVYTRGKLHDSSLSLFNDLNLPIINPVAKNQKRIIKLDQSELEFLTKGIRVKCFLVPNEINGANPQEISSGEVFRHLAPYSTSGLLGGLERSFLRTKRAISNTKAFKVHLKKSEKDLLYDVNSLWNSYE